MISGADARPAAAGPAPIVWITGLSGTGKTMLATSVVDALRDTGVRALLLDGDAVRIALESPEDSLRHEREFRVMRAWRIAELARSAAMQGMPVVVATISLVHSVQAWNRSGPAPYGEVLMTAGIEALRQRNPGLYGDERCAGSPSVVGVDIAAEFPLRPELSFEQRFRRGDLPGHTRQVVTLWQALLRPAAARA